MCHGYEGSARRWREADEQRRRYAFALQERERRRRERERVRAAQDEELRRFERAVSIEQSPVETR